MHPTPGPYRPDPAPHIRRTALIVASCVLAMVLVVAWVVSSDRARPLPQEYVTPVWYTPTSGYDPGLYTPFTQAPK